MLQNEKLFAKTFNFEHQNLKTQHQRCQINHTKIQINNQSITLSQCQQSNSNSLKKQTQSPKIIIDSKVMPYQYECQHSVSVSDESSFTEQCSICITFRRGFTIWIHQQHYARETSYIGRSLRAVNSIFKSKTFFNADLHSSFFINYKQAMIMAKDKQIIPLKYKNWDQVTQQVRSAIFSNLNSYQHYDKMYFGENNLSSMSKYRTMKKALNELRQNNKSQSKQKFKITKLALFPQSNNLILLDSTLKRNYEFFPVDAFSRQQKSKLQTSIQEISKLKKNISLMISDIKLNDQSYPTTKNFFKPFINFVKPKQELKFRKMLEAEISEIHQDNKLRFRKTQHMRLYTSPDPQEDRETERKYAQVYGFLLQQNPEVKKKNKKSLIRKQISRQKSSSNLSRTKLTNYTKSSRQTQQSSHLMISATNNSTTLALRKSQSKSKLKGSSRNKILLTTSSSANKLRMVSPNLDREKSVNKSKKLLMQYR